MDANNFQTLYVQHQIRKQFGDKVDILSTARSLVKFGKNLDIDSGVEETIWITGGDEVYATSNSIINISSNNVADTQNVVVIGHTVDANGDFTRVQQTVTLNGQTPVLLPTPLARVERAWNDNAIDFLGNIYIYEADTVTLGEPDTQAKKHLTINPVDNQSLKAAFTVDKDEYIILNALTISVNKQSNSIADFRIQFRLKGKVFRSTYTCTVDSSTGSQQLFFPQPLIAIPNMDVKISATAAAANTGVEAIFHCYVAEKTYKYNV